jgi:hypothetical protein
VNIIGFNVPKWTNKPIKDFTNEELLEYWYKLRLSFLGKSGKVVNGDSPMVEWYVVDLQEEILKRMNKD